MGPTSRSAAILIVEDDPNDVLFLQRALRKAGFRHALRVARDGQDAILYLSGDAPFDDREKYPVPCLIVLDLKMPRKNGLEVLQWLRRRDGLKDMPVVMITSSNEEGDRAEALRQGVAAFRVKPVSFEELLTLAGEIRREAEVHCKDVLPRP
jgi:CheY-like chemotaxis protein